MYQISITLFIVASNQILLSLSHPHHGMTEYLRRDPTKFDPFSRKLELKWIQDPSKMIESHEHQFRKNPQEASSSARETLIPSATEQVEHEKNAAIRNIMTGEGKSEGVIHEMDDHDLKSLPSEAGEIINSEESRVDDPRTGSQDMLADATHHGGGGGHGGWLDMGAYSGKKGAFGWYADFPVGYG